MFFSVSNVISDVYLFMYHRISRVLLIRVLLKPRYAGFMPSAQDFNKCKSHDLTKSKHQLPYSCFNRISSTFRSLSNLQYTTLHTHKLSYQIAKHQYANIDPTTPERYSTHDNCSAMMPRTYTFLQLCRGFLLQLCHSLPHTRYTKLASISGTSHKYASHSSFISRFPPNSIPLLFRLFTFISKQLNSIHFSVKFSHPAPFEPLRCHCQYFMHSSRNQYIYIYYLIYFSAPFLFSSHISYGTCIIIYENKAYIRIKLYTKVITLPRM